MNFFIGDRLKKQKTIDTAKKENSSQTSEQVTVKYKSNINVYNTECLLLREEPIPAK